MADGRHGKTAMPAPEARRTPHREPEQAEARAVISLCVVSQGKAFIRPALTMFGSIKLLTRGRAGSGTDFSSMQMRMMG